VTAPARPPARRPLRPLRTVRRSAFWWNLSKYCMLAFCKLWFRLRVEGRQHVPAAGSVLLVANHSSYLDPPLVGVSTRRWIGYLAQAGLASFPPMRWWLAQVGVTLIDRSAPSKDALRLVADHLSGGEAVGLFPEGTRSVDGTVGPFRTGVEFLVRRTGALVVPVGLDGASRAFPRGALLPRPRRIVVRFGEPWLPERVLAPGGVDALRACVAALANAPLREGLAGEPSRSPAAPAPGAAAPETRSPPSSSSSADGGA